LDTFCQCGRSALAVELESMEARMSQEEPVNLDSFGRAASHLRRLLEALGLCRRAKDITPPGSALSTIWEIEGRADDEPECEEDSK